MKINIGKRAIKIGGSYQAEGLIKAQFEANDGSVRYVFEFDVPKGMLHIFSAHQLDIIEPK